MTKRRLEQDEIAVLEARGCRAADWAAVVVAAGWTPGASFHDVTFSGRVELGVFDGVALTPEGFFAPAGVVRSHLHNVSLGDNCLVSESRIASADIGREAVVEQVALLAGPDDGEEGPEGVRIAVLAEDGARSVVLWRSLSAQFAHLLCHLRGSPAALALEAMIRRDCAECGPRGLTVGSHARIRRCGALRNVRIGPAAQLDDVAALDRCLIESTPEAPAMLGEGVSARQCVFLPSCRVTGGVRLDGCLVGEGVVLRDAFTGRQSLFFANSEFAQGEAACAMAGPFAGSTHKASLVLTCQTSFSTFGSGANSSNHHFKLGPRHGGVLRRGVKCGSGSYVFWPSDIGAFSTVVGRHARNLDTTAFPFSLLLGDGSASILIPGANLFSCGLRRDELKWIERDRRAGLASSLDLVNSAVLSPYVLQAMEAGEPLLEAAEAAGDDVRHGGATIPAGRVAKARELYAMARTFHAGLRLFERMKADKGEDAGVDAALAALAETPDEEADPSDGRWRDWGGMLLSGAMAEKYLADLQSGALADPAMALLRLREIHTAYADHEWLWLASDWRRRNGFPTAESVKRFVCEWREAVHYRHRRFFLDAEKEFRPEAMYGHGVEEYAGENFFRVRGTAADHPLVVAAEAEREALLRLASSIPEPPL